jgi:hypothetical protein
VQRKTAESTSPFNSIPPNAATPQKDVDVKLEPETKTVSSRRSPSPSPSYKHVGLLNGTYIISSPDIQAQRRSSELSLILCLDTPRVWGAFDFGRYSGVFLLDQRPYRASDEPLPIQWRGREYGIGKVLPCEGDASWIAFLGDGEIEGCLDLDGEIGFWGRRVTMSSARNIRSIREEWNSYAPEDWS